MMAPVRLKSRGRLGCATGRRRPAYCRGGAERPGAMPRSALVARQISVANDKRFGTRELHVILVPMENSCRGRARGRHGRGGGGEADDAIQLASEGGRTCQNRTPSSRVREAAWRSRGTSGALVRLDRHVALRAPRVTDKGARLGSCFFADIDCNPLISPDSRKFFATFGNEMKLMEACSERN